MTSTDTSAVTPGGASTAVAADRPRPRIPALDILRGFALCGILFVNIGPVGHFQPMVPLTLDDASGWLQLGVQQRFFPIFSLLFGMGFSLFLASAARRTSRPRLVLLRRLLVLLPVGVLHQLFHPGEALTFYAVFGLIVLLPSSWLPRWMVAVGGSLLFGATVFLFGGGWVLIPSLFLIGSALVRYGVADRMGTSARGPAVLFALFAAVAVPALVLHTRDLAGSNFSTSSAVAGLALAGTYVTAILVLLRTPLRGALDALFAPLGRMALTNYIAATPVMILAGHVLDWPNGTSWTPVLLVAAAILAVQWVLSTLWLRHFRQGPLEWLWRWATWLERPPMRRER